MPRARTSITCSRAGCEVPVLSASAKGIPWCSSGCRVLSRTATAIANCKSVPRGRDHAKDVEQITRMFPYGSAAAVTLSDREWNQLIALRDVYIGKRDRSPRNT